MVVWLRSGKEKAAAFLPFSSILFRLYLYPLWSVSSKAFWTSQKRALRRRHRRRLQLSRHRSSFPRLAAQLLDGSLAILGRGSSSVAAAQLVYLYGHTSTHHGEKNKSLQGS